MVDKREAHEVPAFVGISHKSLEDALELAGEAAAREHKGKRFDVVRQEVVIKNPGISEYIVVIASG